MMLDMGLCSLVFWVFDAGLRTSALAASVGAIGERVGALSGITEGEVRVLRGDFGGAALGVAAVTAEHEGLRDEERGLNS